MKKLILITTLLFCSLSYAQDPRERMVSLCDYEGETIFKFLTNGEITLHTKAYDYESFVTLKVKEETERKIIAELLDDEWIYTYVFYKDMDGLVSNLRQHLFTSDIMLPDEYLELRVKETEDKALVLFECNSTFVMS